MKKLVILCLLPLLQPFLLQAEEPAPGRQVEQELKIGEKSIGYLLYLPKDFKRQGARTPLMLFLHEAPRIGKSSGDTLKPGHIVTVEPGLYYPGLGGVRLEDMAYVTKSSPKNLTKFEKILEV